MADVKGDSPSAQPLLASMAQQGSTLPTDVYQQSVAASGVPERAGESQFGMQSLQSNQASSAALHEAPTAPYQERKPPPSYSAYEKADGPSGKTTRFTEWHAHFVKDNIDVNTHEDFFVKLGLSRKDYGATMYDNRHSGIREQIRHVLTDVFIQKQGYDDSLYKVIRALKASGNGLVADEFIEEFGVTSS